MNRKLVVDEAAAEEAEAQVRYYAERAGTLVALRFVAEIEAIYRGLAEGHFIGVNHQRVRFRLPVKRVFIDRFPFAVVFYVEDETVYIIAIEALRKRPGYWHSRLRSR
jgi:plasmid stabilization system protein ParE